MGDDAVFRWVVCGVVLGLPGLLHLARAFYRADFEVLFLMAPWSPGPSEATAAGSSGGSGRGRSRRPFSPRRWEAPPIV